MNRRKCVHFVCFIFLITLVLQTSASFADTRNFSSLENVGEENLFLGNVLTIRSNYCWQNARPGTKQSRIKLEIFENNAWRPIGRVKFVKDTACPKKYPFAQTFVWEVDRIGEASKEYGQFGTLKLRNRVAKPAVYVEARVFKSANAFNDYQEQRVGDAGAILMCTLSGGQWISESKICVKK